MYGTFHLVELPRFKMIETLNSVKRNIRKFDLSAVIDIYTFLGF